MEINRIKAFVERLSSEHVCDDCVRKRLGIGDVLVATTSLNELAGTADFERLIGPCALCGETSQVLRHR